MAERESDALVPYMTKHVLEDLVILRRTRKIYLSSRRIYRTFHRA